MGKDVILSPAEVFRDFNPEIREGDIHLWACRQDPDSDLYRLFEQSISVSERKNASFFSFEKVKQGYITSQGFLKILLAFYLGIESSEVITARQRKGKPFLLNDPTLHFNLSNSGEYVVIAISRHGEVGIDLEKIRPLNDLEDLVEKNFSPKEKEYITKIHAEKLIRFFKLWTLKESFLKAIGEGMRLTPDNLEFSINNGRFSLHSLRGFFEFEDWRFHNLNISNEYLGSLAHHAKPQQISELRIIE